MENSGRGVSLEKKSLNQLYWGEVFIETVHERKIQLPIFDISNYVSFIPLHEELIFSIKFYLSVLR